MDRIPVIYEDEDLVVVNKPAGLPSQAGHDSKRPNLYDLVQSQRGEKLYLHHRLDKDTSGVLLLGRHPRANKGLTDLFREHQLQKIYWALTKKGASEAPDQWSLTNFLAPVRGPGQKLMRMVTVKSGGWRAETHFRTLARGPEADLIEARPVTGRTHQIRVHLATPRRPILGDFLYGGKSERVPRLMLHARKLKIRHPVTSEELTFRAPAPADFIGCTKEWVDLGALDET